MRFTTLDLAHWHIFLLVIALGINALDLNKPEAMGFMGISLPPRTDNETLLDLFMSELSIKEIVRPPPKSFTIKYERQSVEIPHCLSFQEPLVGGLRPEDIVIFSGGDSLKRRKELFGAITSEALTAFAGHHGYRLAFLDELEYDTSRTHAGTKYHPAWCRVFAMPALRSKYPDAKYFVWLDDDILVVHEETDMLNHYINKMERDPSWEMTFVEEGAQLVLNSGMFIMRSTNFGFDNYKQLLDIGLEDDGKLAREFGYEQDAMAIHRKRHGLQDSIRIIKHREDPVYGFNLFSRRAVWDALDAWAYWGDAFVHFLGATAKTRDWHMRLWLVRKREWKRKLPASLNLPVQRI